MVRRRDHGHRSIAVWRGLAMALMTVVLLQGAESIAPMANVYLAGGGSPSISAFAFEEPSGRLIHVETTRLSGAPGFLAWSQDQGCVYGCARAGSGGQILTCRRDPGTGRLEAVGTVTSGGSGPCHLAVHPQGPWLYVAHYEDGTVSLLRLGADGIPGQPQQVVPAGRRAHMAQPTPDGRFLLVPCLGEDQVLTYAIDGATGSLTTHPISRMNLMPGSGPRHLAFHPNGRWVYVVGELTATVTRCIYDSASGVLSEPRSVPTLPPGFTGRPWAAHVQVAPDGRHAYVSNRAHDHVALLTLDAASGMPTLVGQSPDDGDLKTPRHFLVTRDGKRALVASQGGDRLTVFRVNPDDGAFATAQILSTSPGPSCVIIIP